MISKTKEDWTFKEIKTQEFTHGLHQYPARMHPEIAKRLIAKFTSKKSDLVFDPFMGSGTVLVEAMLHGKNSIGIDLNPFAVLLSNVKTTPLDAKKLETTFKQIISNSKKDKQQKTVYDNAPVFTSRKSKKENLDFWFPNEAINDLQILKNYVFLIKDKQISDFFKICFSLTTRRVSFQKNSIYKIYRMQDVKRKEHKRPQKCAFSSTQNIWTSNKSKTEKQTKKHTTRKGRKTDRKRKKDGKNTHPPKLHLLRGARTVAF